MGALGLGWQAFVDGAVDDSLRSLRLSASTFHTIGDLRGWALASTQICWLSHRKGNLAALVAPAAEMFEIGRGAGDPHIVIWGQHHLGMHAFTAGLLDAGRRPPVGRRRPDGTHLAVSNAGQYRGPARTDAAQTGPPRGGGRSPEAIPRPHRGEGLSRRVVVRSAQRVRRALPHRCGAALGRGASAGDAEGRPRLRQGARGTRKRPLAARDLPSAGGSGVAPAIRRRARRWTKGLGGRDGPRSSGRRARIVLEVVPAGRRGAGD